MNNTQEAYEHGFNNINRIFGLAMLTGFKVTDDNLPEFRQRIEKKLEKLKTLENTSSNQMEINKYSCILGGIDRINKDKQEYLEKRAREQKLKKLTIEIKPKTDKGKMLLDELLREGIDFEYHHQD